MSGFALLPLGPLTFLDWLSAIDFRVGMRLQFHSTAKLQKWGLLYLRKKKNSLKLRKNELVLKIILESDEESA